VVYLGRSEGNDAALDLSHSTLNLIQAFLITTRAEPSGSAILALNFSLVPESGTETWFGSLR
jgi:hypothetical protein